MGLPENLKNILLWCGLLFLPGAYAVPGLYAQVPVIELNQEIDGERITHSFSLYKSDDHHEPGHIWSEMNLHPNTGELDFGFTDSFFWLGISVENISDIDEWLFELENPHINNIYFYKRAGESRQWALIDSTGRRTSFSTRRNAHFNFLFSLDTAADQSADFLLLLDKRNSSLNYHTRVWKKSTFNQVQQTQYALYGSYFGIFVLILLASLIAYFFSRKKIYLWYVLYVLSVGVFIFTDTGLSHQYLWPESDSISTFARIVLTYSMLLFFILFTGEYFNTKTHYPNIHRAFNVLTGLILLHGLIYFFFTSTFQENATLFLTILYGIILSAISLAIWTSVHYLNRQRNVALFFIAAFSFIFVAGFITILTEYGLFSDKVFLFTPIQIGSVFEILFLTFGLGWRVKVVNQEHIELQGRISRLQNEKLKAYIEGIEEERKRLAMDLHDSVGNQLAHLKRLIEKRTGSDTVLKDEIQLIIQDIRLLSHQLSPPSISLTGLEQSIRHLIQETNQESKIQYLFQSLDIPEKLPEDYSIQIYRIVQEAVQNIEKHSLATEAIIQFISHSDQLILTIEDDGVGFSDNNDARRNGIGLGNINKRVEQLDGTLEMTTQKNKGVQFLIALPLPRSVKPVHEEQIYDAAG